MLQELITKLEAYSQKDQTYSVAELSWDEYEAIANLNISKSRISFYNGVITVLSPGLNHEVIKELIGILIEAYCEQKDLIYYPMGSTTLKKPPLVGKEPDTSYSFGSRKPIPDLAVEIVFSSGGINDLEKYQLLGVEEVWFWQNNRLSFYVMDNNYFRQVSSSKNLPGLNSKLLLEFIDRAFQESPLVLKKEFLCQI
jgi:Uma2 family endonuclease